MLELFLWSEKYGMLVAFLAIFLLVVVQSSSPEGKGPSRGGDSLAWVHP
jgi:hypothetical protein